MDNGSDWDLVASAREGDVAAFAELVKRYQTPVIHFCVRMLGSVPDAEDIAQESFIRLHRHLGRLKPKAKFSTVLFGIARNLTLNALRDAARRGRPMARSLDTESAADTFAANESAQPDHEASQHELEHLIQRGMARLTPEHREVLMLRAVEGLDYASIARICRCRKGTVKSRLARAREQLRAEMKVLGGERS